MVKIAEMDEALLYCCVHGVADSVWRMYRSGLNRCLSSCFAFGVPTPFSHFLNNALLFRYVASTGGNHTNHYQNVIIWQPL